MNHCPVDGRKSVRRRTAAPPVPGVTTSVAVRETPEKTALIATEVTLVTFPVVITNVAVL
jgi:hypothetical protein